MDQIKLIQFQMRILTGKLVSHPLETAHGWPFFFASPLHHDSNINIKESPSSLFIFFVVTVSITLSCSCWTILSNFWHCVFGPSENHHGSAICQLCLPFSHVKRIIDLSTVRAHNDLDTPVLACQSCQVQARNLQSLSLLPLENTWSQSPCLWWGLKWWSFSSKTHKLQMIVIVRIRLHSHLDKGAPITTPSST